MTETKKQIADIVAVAKAARVSISTVSRAFNHPDMVKPATRKRIDAAVKRLGYIRNRAAQAMHGRRSATIGLVVPTIDHAIFAEVVQAFSDAVDAKGFTMLLASHGYDLGREYAVLRKFLEHRVDGVALIGLEHSDETLRLVDSQGIPALSIWNYAAGGALPSIGADNRAAGRMAADHLLALGHRDIATIFPPVGGNDRARDRRTGVDQALAAAGVVLSDARVAEVRYAITDAKLAASRLLATAPRPTAILCGNDVLAVGALYAARAAGLSVPGDVSVIGIGDFRGSADMEPALTTVRLPARQIGGEAGRALAAAITGEAPMTSLACPIELRQRDTCRALNA